MGMGTNIYIEGDGDQGDGDVITIYIEEDRNMPVKNGSRGLVERKYLDRCEYWLMCYQSASWYFVVVSGVIERISNYVSILSERC